MRMARNSLMPLRTQQHQHPQTDSSPHQTLYIHNPILIYTNGPIRITRPATSSTYNCTPHRSIRTTIIPKVIFLVPRRCLFVIRYTILIAIAMYPSIGSCIETPHRFGIRSVPMLLYTLVSVGRMGLRRIRDWRDFPRRFPSRRPFR